VDSQAWGRYLAAAVVLGVHRKLLPKLQAVDGSGQEIMPGWFWYNNGHTGSLAGGRSSLSDSVSSMVSSLSTSMSSATGAGGGASGGGGAGGGGGGAG
jgi:uncharacterized membrane protein